MTITCLPYTPYLIHFALCMGRGRQKKNHALITKTLSKSLQILSFKSQGPNVPSFTNQSPNCPRPKCPKPKYPGPKCPRFKCPRPKCLDTGWKTEIKFTFEKFKFSVSHKYVSNLSVSPLADSGFTKYYRRERQFMECYLRHLLLSWVFHF